MLTGELPLGKFAPPARKVQVDVRFDEVVLRALAKEPELRYQQASEVKTAVETITSTAPAKPDGEKTKTAARGEPVPGFAPQPKADNLGSTSESVRTQFVILAVAWWIGTPLMIIGDLLPRPAGLLVDVLSLPALIVEAVF